MSIYDLSKYRFYLPEELIEQRRRILRDACRLMLVKRGKGPVGETLFYKLPELLNETDVLVINDARVFPARLRAKRKTGGKVEVLLLNNVAGEKWEALVRPSARLKVGEVVFLDGGEVRLCERFGEGRWLVEVRVDYTKHGEVPFPPYIKFRPPADAYQTVYAKGGRAVAAPTAGLHFTKELLEKLSKKVKVVSLTLDVSWATFSPVKTKDIRNHKMHTERFFIPEETAHIINQTVSGKGRIVAVGTTVVRVLESFEGPVKPGRGETSLYIYPGFKFKKVSALITNFHTPGSSLILLVSAFAGYRPIMKAYKLAIKKRYGFFSLGEAMFIF